MDKLSSAQNILRKIADLFVGIWQFLGTVYARIWTWLNVRIPFVRALVKRHTDNPSTIFVDIAILILSLYAIFGLIGYILIYPQKSETKFAEKLALLYPYPAAKVDQSLVWSNTFLKRLRFLNTFNAQAPKDAQTKPPTDTELRERVAAGLIEDKIIVLEAKQRGIRVTQEELDKALEKQGNPDDIEKQIRQLYGMSLNDFKEIIAEQVLKEKVKNTVLTKVRIRHILVSTQSVASEAKAQVESGKDFAEVAKEYTQDANTKESGGDLGYWRKGELSTQIAPGFEEAAFNLQVNQVSGPVQSPFGFHIIQVTERDGDNLQSYDEWYKQRLDNYTVKRYIRI